ncbi:hypothetical protein [Streptomyces sp. Wb2n-11]|uniref:hypothetical protein n=1 Tax=Streptomyces sp. Wb2n-11 TaxID=1030533 RepID=UPI000AFC0252|nr:hypothetical protein [Streptomyces sp. Wb2n-11]
MTRADARGTEIPVLDAAAVEDTAAALVPGPEVVLMAADGEGDALPGPGEPARPGGDPSHPSPDAPAPVPVPIDDPVSREDDGGMPPDTLPPPLGG